MADYFLLVAHHFVQVSAKGFGFVQVSAKDLWNLALCKLVQKVLDFLGPEVLRLLATCCRK